MEPSLNDRLLAIEAKIDQNQKTITKIRQAQKNAAYVRIAYWAFIILAGFGALYFIQPFLGQIGEAYGITGSTNNGDSLNSSNLLEQLRQFNP